MRRLLILLAAVGLMGAAKPAPPAPVDYTVAPEFTGEALTGLEITVRFAADPSGTTRLDLPDHSAGVTEMWRYLKDIQVDGADSVAEDGPAHRLVRAPPGAPLTVRYRVVSAFDHDPGPNELETYRPTIRPRWFWAYGQAIFLEPATAETARFHWTGAPAAYPFASDLEHPAGRPMSMRDLFDSVVVGGPDLKVITRDAAGAPVRIGVIGAYPGFTADAFADMTARVIAGERAFWGEREGPFLVALAPLAPVSGWKSTRGEGRGDAFAIMTTRDIPLSFLRTTLAHEYFHTWNPWRLGRMAGAPAERADYWFSEGFTDFYARRLLLRSGVFSLEEFAADWNDALRAYANNPARLEPNRRVVERFWSDGAVEKLPYQRGAILAARWDAALRARSGGRVDLDTVMRALRHEAARATPGAGAPGAGTPPVFAAARFAAVARRFGLDIGPDREAVVEGGAPALLPADAFGSCLAVTTTEAPALDRGFDTEALGTDRVIHGVKPESAAYAAGLRDGMTLVRRESPDPVDSRTLMTLRVRLDGVEQTVSYRPAGAASVTLQTVVVPPGLTPAARAACTREAAGG